MNLRAMTAMVDPRADERVVIDPESDGGTVAGSVAGPGAGPVTDRCTVVGWLRHLLVE